jgi:sporulation protein YlmC with PRC-barrel domain
MKRELLLGAALIAMLGATPIVAMADSSTSPGNSGVGNVQIAAAEVDAGKIVGEEVYDTNGNKIGEVDSVMVDQNGKVASVIIDISGWLQSEKLIAVKWSDLKMGADGKIVSSLTKENAQSAQAYQYKDKTMRGQVMTESGERYAAGGAAQPATTGTTDTTGTTTDTTKSSIVNADGSLNASKLIGLNVQSPEDKKVGDIGEVVLDKSGKVDGVVVDVGGFLGIGTHRVLLNWNDVQLTSQDGKDRAVVNLTKDKLEQMPAYETSNK